MGEGLFASNARPVFLHFVSTFVDGSLSTLSYAMLNYAHASEEVPILDLPNVSEIVGSVLYHYSFYALFHVFLFVYMRNIQ